MLGKMEFKVIFTCVMINFIESATSKPNATLKSHLPLQCYDCSPRPSQGAADCVDPQNVAVLSSELLCTNIKIKPNDSLMCYSIFIDVKGYSNETGIYRGCAMAKEQQKNNFCDWVKKDGKDFFVQNNASIVLKSCITCSSPRCNVQTFNPDGTLSNADKNVISFVCFPLMLLFLSLSI